eukprot:Lithocolla_globosa_v1_NODE_248_length_4862_cov_4.242147.p1 type:complete len:525 gc:universal NODE_248_length_4862_cov_4.242147:911-2485(+)
MISNQLHQKIDKRLQQVRDNPLPFGGVHVLFVGDLFQLKPMKDGGGWVFEPTSVSLISEFNTSFWRSRVKLYELTQIMRQKDDLKFAQILNRLREGNHTNTDITYLRKRVRKLTHKNFDSNCVYLAQENKICDRINKIAAKKKGNDIRTYIADDKIPSDMPLSQRNKIPSCRSGQLRYELQLSVGVAADISTNIKGYHQDGMVNGESGIIREMTDDIIFWEPNDPTVGKKWKRDHSHWYKNQPREWLPIARISKSFTLHNKSNFSIPRHQFPLYLSTAKTFHKAQGDSFDNLYVNFEGTHRPDFHYVYVALSRVRSVKGLRMNCLLDQDIKVDPLVAREMARLRSGPLKLYYKPTSIVPDKLRSIYLNVDHLREKSTVIQSDEMFANSDIICFAETKLHKDTTGESLFPVLKKQFSFVKLNGPSQHCQGMLILVRKTLNATCDVIRTQNVELCLVRIANVKIIYVYRAPSVGLPKFRYVLKELLKTYGDDFLCVFGDCNLHIPFHKSVTKILTDNQMTSIQYVQ